jgi:hypothetical protein
MVSGYALVPRQWNIEWCLGMLPLVGAALGMTDEASCMDKRQGFSLDTLPSSEFEGDRTQRDDVSWVWCRDSGKLRKEVSQSYKVNPNIYDK